MRCAGTDGHRSLRGRVTAKLVSVATGEHVWAKKFDRPLQEVFAVQDEIVSSIVGSSIGRLIHAVADDAAARAPVELAAYELVLRARKVMSHGEVGEVETLLSEALAIAPDYAHVHALLSHVLWVRFNETLRRQPLEEAIRSARRAVDLDPDDAFSHASLGFCYLFNRQFTLAGIHSRRAVDLNPEDLKVLNLHAQMLVRSGYPEEALAVLDEVMRRDPFAPAHCWENRVIILLVLRRFEDSIAATRHISGLAWWNHYYLASAHAQLGQFAEARAHRQEMNRLKKGVTIRQIMLAEPYRLRTHEDQFIAGLRAAGIPD